MSANAQHSGDTDQETLVDTPPPPTPPDAATLIGPPPPPPTDRPASAEGDTWISDTIVAKVAGAAALEVAGVLALRPEGGGRTWGRGPKETAEAAVTVEDALVSVDLRLVVADRVRIPDVVDTVRARVVDRVEQATGMRVAKVDIGVVDIVTDSSAQDGAQGDAEPPDSAPSDS